MPSLKSLAERPPRLFHEEVTSLPQLEANSFSSPLAVETT